MKKTLGLLEQAESEHVARNDLAFAVRLPDRPDAFVVTLWRPVHDWFELTATERTALFALIDDLRARAHLSPMHLRIDTARPGADDPQLRVEVSGLPAERLAPLTTGAPRTRLGDFLGGLFTRSDRATIIVAFTQVSGVERIESSVVQCLARGADVRLVTGDYLHITQADALQRLLDLRARISAYSETGDTELDDLEYLPGRFDVRIVETRRIQRSFHPKAWLFEWADDAVAYVGSSNLSRSALEHGIEWNLRLERSRDPVAWAAIESEADALWTEATPLTDEWLDDYRRRTPSDRLPFGEIVDEQGPPPAPRDVQVEALTALRESRARGDARALVVLATGLGKTFLAAFDVFAFAQQMEGRSPRVLFLAHRRELLSQAATTFRRVLPRLRFTWCAGAAADVGGDVVFASVQKLGRQNVLDGIAADAFDYVIVDEVHHAAAPSYRRILDHLRPRFLLGLTATPDRADEADVLGIFDDNLPYRAGLPEGISRGLLVPFAYHGLADTVDYAPIPWRSGRFDPAVLSDCLQTERRMDALWRAWTTLPGTRSLVFCASIAHATFVRSWLRGKGVRIEAVHSGPDAFDRSDGLRRLEDGTLDALCTVDLFNEGIDCKPIDRVVMLRPTESTVIFLQQLGRGLRIAEGKERLQVIDFVGNHRVFLDRMRMLLSLGHRPTALGQWVNGQTTPDLPAGCSIDVELEAKELLARLLPTSSDNHLVRVYRELRAARGRRPRAGELQRMGLNPASVVGVHPHWLAFVRAEGDLTEAESGTVLAATKWFARLGARSRPLRTVLAAIEHWLDVGAPAEGVLLEDLPAILDDRARIDIEALRALDDAHLQVSDDTLRIDPGVALTLDLVALSHELVDWQLVRHRRREQMRLSAEASGLLARFRLKVLRNERNPILHFGTVKHRNRMPRGETDVRLPDGAIWQFRFVKIAVNVARPVGAPRNQLPDLLTRWFGPDAGRAGTEQFVEFHRGPDGWWIEPVETKVMPLRRDEIRAWPSLRAAAGSLSADGVHPLPNDAVDLRLPLARRHPDDFAVRATGDSMDGGRNPIRHGDWLQLRWARAAGPGNLVGRVVLVEMGDADEGAQYLVKRLVRADGRFLLRSDNPAFDDLPAEGAMTVRAVVMAAIPPEILAPPPGTLIDGGDVGEIFGLSQNPESPWMRVDGHLFVFVDTPGALVEPDRLRFEGTAAQPGETAYLLTRRSPSDQWRYAGVARHRDGDDWHHPAVDYETWRALGHGRGASRRIAERWLEAARLCAEGLATMAGQWVEARGQRCRIAGRAAKGGVRIDGGLDGFGERTVSLLDLAWVLCTRATAPGPVDEAAVNRQRYLDGTPKSSTRWIDTGWALVLTELRVE